MFLLRVGIIVALVIAVLPANEQQQAQLYDRAAAAVHWTTTFCDRNGPTCTQANELWETFVSKAKFGARMAYDMAVKYSDNAGGDYWSPAGFTEEQGTLRPEDREPVWRGGPSGTGA